MTEFIEQELPGARFQTSNLRGASFTDVYLDDARFRDVILSGAEFRMVHLHDVRMRGVELHDVDIHGELDNVVINGVEVSAYVEAELDRPWDRDAQPPLDEVLALRGEPGWPQIEDFPLKECLRIVLNEEWHHRLYAERDLDLLQAETSENGS